MDDQQQLKFFFNQTKEQAAHVMSQSHVSKDIRDVIRDLLIVVDNFDKLFQSISAESSDKRFFKKKLDQLKNESKATEEKAEGLKQMMFSIMEEIKNINGEVAQILKRHEAKHSSAIDALSANRIKSSTQKIIEMVVGKAA